MIVMVCLGFPQLFVSYQTTGKRDAAVAHITLDDIPDPCLKEKLTYVC